MPFQQVTIASEPDARKAATAQRLFVYLAYLDDSGGTDTAFRTLCGVLIDDKQFLELEMLIGMYVEGLVPEDRLPEFKEFHAWELFGGHGIYKDVQQEHRFELIEELLKTVQKRSLAIVYGAVDQIALQSKPYASADPLDICFRICVEGIQGWMKEHADRELALLIADDCDGKTKAVLKRSFRQFRKPIRPPDWADGGIWSVHDEMYFGDSRDSIGIQLADLCGYVISKHLENNVSCQGYYDIIKGQIVYCRVEPT